MEILGHMRSGQLRRAMWKDATSRRGRTDDTTGVKDMPRRRMRADYSARWAATPLRRLKTAFRTSR
jgi:hypothetical protein